MTPRLTLKDTNARSALMAFDYGSTGEVVVGVVLREVEGFCHFLVFMGVVGSSWDLSYNQLSGNIPSGFGSLSQLAYLVLDNNRLDGSIPVGIKTLSRLALL
ncbi:unnamed protein product [Closterium sp. NIES-53]